MRGVCACGKLLNWRFGDGDEECADCREKRQESNLPPAIRTPEAWQPVRGRIGGSGYGRETCLAHLQPEPCTTCAAYKAAGL